MRILITGGGGQLGTALSRLLSKHRINFSAPGYRELDILDTEAVASFLDRPVRGETVSIVIHAAALTKVDLCETNRDLAFAVNAEAAGRMADLCAARRISIVYISTDFVFAGLKGTPYEINDETGPLNVYGESKLAGEHAVQRATDLHYVVRTSWVFGENGENFPAAILKSAAKGTELRVVDDQLGAPTYALDLAEIILSLLGIDSAQSRASDRGRLDSPLPYGTYHATNTGSCNWYEFAREIVAQSGWGNSVKSIKSTELNRPARRPEYSVLSLESLNEFGLTTRHWRDALSAFLPILRVSKPEMFPQSFFAATDYGR